jgi:hypothetical protein
MTLGAAGTKTLMLDLALPLFTNTTRDGVPNFNVANGLVELQLQYPFSASGTGDVLDITVHEIRIVPGPATPTLIGLAALPAWRRRRRGASNPRARG